jgi:hypothetical protein
MEGIGNIGGYSYVVDGRLHAVQNSIVQVQNQYDLSVLFETLNYLLLGLFDHPPIQHKTVRLSHYRALNLALDKLQTVTAYILIHLFVFTNGSTHS